MRILFVTPYVPSRIRVRPYNFIKALSSSHEVSLVSLLCDEYERAMAQEIAPFCSSIDLVPLPKWRSYANCLRALPTLTPLRVAYYRSHAFNQRILQVIQQHSTQVIHGELIKVAPALHSTASHSSLPVLYDSVDTISSYLQQQYRSARNPLSKAFVYSELLKMRRYESRIPASFQKIVITSQPDRDVLVKLGVNPQLVEVVSNGVDTTYFTPPSTPREQDSLVFCAKMDYYPNSQAMLRFCAEILPLIWKQRPQVRLTIVGNNPPQAVRDLASDTRITVTGYVPDIRPYLAKASVVLAPLIVAAGMQNKVLEALAMGAPTVSTPASCRSLQVSHQTHLLIAEAPRQFAKAVLELLQNTQMAHNLAQAGRRYVEEHHSWTAAASTLSALYHQLAAASDRSQALTRTS